MTEEARYSTRDGAAAYPPAVDGSSEAEVTTAAILYVLRKMRPFFQPRQGYADAADLDDVIAVKRGLAEVGLKIVIDEAATDG